MKLIRFASGAVLQLALCASASTAQVQRTFVSGLGNDVNPCSRTAPCRTFGQAISQTNTGGEVYALDTAGYGPFSINKSVSIVAPQGVTAGISVFAGDGIDINAGASDLVVLRGLTINGQGGNNGVVFNTGGALRVEDCAVSGFPAINQFPSAGSGILLAGGRTVVKDTVISDCTFGITTNLNTGTAFVTMDHITVEGLSCCSVGVSVTSAGTANVRAAIRDSTISDAGAIGIETLAAGTSSAFLDVERCLVANGGDGLHTDQDTNASSAMSISNCLISHNQHGFEMFGGTILTRGNNGFFGNGSNIGGSLTPVSSQ